MSGGGFGICGHKNQFSTGVRCGNWVEDTVGGVLAKRHLAEGPAGYKGAMSETQQHYDVTVVKAMANKEKFRAQDSEDQLIALRGLPNHLLFGHEGDYTAQTRYRTTAEAANYAHSKFARTSRDKLMRRKKIADKMAAIADHFETQDKRASREMQIQTITHEKKDFRAPEGGDEEHLKDVPKDRRHTTFVSTFKPGIRGLRG